MNVYRLWAGIIRDQVLLDVANSRYCALERILDEHSFLRVHHLVVALLELLVNLYIFYIQRSKVLEDLIWLPLRNDRFSGLIFLGRHLLHFDLLLHLVHGLCKLEVICSEFRSFKFENLHVRHRFKL